MDFRTFYNRLYLCFKHALKPAFKTIKWLLSLMIPISLVVMLLDYSGVLLMLSEFLAPAMQFLGLRGEAALVLLTGGLINIYSAIAVMGSIELTMREITILALMTLIAHNLIIETAVQKKTGSSGLWMLALRIITAIVGGLLLNWVLPEKTTTHHGLMTDTDPNFVGMLLIWVKNTFWLTLKVVVIIFILNVLQRILDEFSITKWMSKLIGPLMRFFGLPVQATFMWLIANIIGLAWGSGILIQETTEGRISRTESNILNHHIAISHSLLEDTLLFAVMGVSVFWIVFPRLFLALVVVWLLRWYLYSRQKKAALI